MYIPIHVHSYYSILDGFGSPRQNITRAKKLGFPAIGITDHGNSYGHIAYWTECKKENIKPILGIELYIPFQSATIKGKENRPAIHMVVWAKNKEGWLQLGRLVSKTNDPNYFYYKPRIHLFNNNEDIGLEHFVKDGNIMGFSGHQGSHLSDNLFCDVISEKPEDEVKLLRKAYAQSKISDIEYYRKFLKDNWLESTCELALKLEDTFGKGNFFIELQNELNPEDQLALWIHPLIVECLRKVSKETGIKAVASSDPHYASPEDAEDQRLMVMCNMKETEESVSQKLTSTDELDLMVFFGSNSFYIHSVEEMSKKFTPEELQASVDIANQVENYDISHKPYIPSFKVPNFTKDKYLEEALTEEDKYLLYLTVEGAKRIKPWERDEWKNSNKKPDKKMYWDRLNQEKDVLFKAGLSKYFLVVWDYCMAGDNRPADHSFDWQENLLRNGDIDPIPRADGRGSAAGCLVSYLLGITNIDPLIYDLIFSRFYNEGRNTKDHIELPDIDIDFAVEDRDWIIEYIAQKYGRNNVSQIITFQRMQGKAALKDVFRIKSVQGGFELANEISKFIPNEAEIADELQEMRTAGQEGYGILRWCLDNSISIQEYYQNKDLKPIFDQAIRCEGVKRAQGRHPSGLIVTPQPVDECFPMVLDPRSKQKIIGVDMNDVAKMGGVKYDILGTAILDKMKMVQDLVNNKTPRRNRTEFLEEE
jgi:DNA polymerase-3 subunit alpha